MQDGAILFHRESIEFSLPNEAPVATWIDQVIKSYEKEVGALNYIFTSDDHLLEVNKQYLDHDYYTDIISFDYSEDGLIAGDLFISIDRVRENAKEEGFAFMDELHRVMIHGVLHLLGFGDSTAEEKTQMREKEDYCLTLRGF